MADNVTIPASGTGTATPVVATDDVGGVHYQRVKLDVGGNGVSAPIVGTDGLPIANGSGNKNAEGDPIWTQMVNDSGTHLGETGAPVPVRLFDGSATALGSSANPVNVLGQDAAGAPIQQSSASATVGSVSASATSVTLQAANVGRVGLIIYNDSASSVYVKYGSSASATSFTYKLGPGGTLECGPAGFIYTDIVTGIWDSATGAARVTELT